VDIVCPWPIELTLTVQSTLGLLSRLCTDTELRTKVKDTVIAPSREEGASRAAEKVCLWRLFLPISAVVV
jgi:hypothetical protein